MKKWIALMLACCLAAGLGCAGAEDPGTEPGRGYQFDFTLRLNTEALSPSLRERAQGYADLMEALRFEGSYAQSLTHDFFDLRLNVIPNSRQAKPISFYLHGSRDLMYLNSSLLGDKTVVMSHKSLLEFCTKMYNHMGIPLQHLAYLYPYTYEYNLDMPIADFLWIIDRADKNGVIAPEVVRHVRNGWSYRLEKDPPTQVFVSSAGLGSGHEEAFMAVANELPEYFWKSVAKEQAIQIIRDEARQKETWRAASGDFLKIIRGENYQEISTTLPAMRSGYRPSLFAMHLVNGSWQTGRFSAQLLSTDEQEDDLLDLQASYTSLPISWPANCQSLLNVSLKGGLVPNIGLSAYLTGEENGHFTMRIRKPSPDDEPGATMMTADGFLQPMEGDAQVRVFTLSDGEGGLELFNSNDASFGPFVSEIVQPVVKGALEFLVGVPASSCQTIIDDLQEAGVLAMMLGE